MLSFWRAERDNAYQAMLVLVLPSYAYPLPLVASRFPDILFKKIPVNPRTVNKNLVVSLLHNLKAQS